VSFPPRASKGFSFFAVRGTPNFSFSPRLLKSDTSFFLTCVTYRSACGLLPFIVVCWTNLFPFFPRVGERFLFFLPSVAGRFPILRPILIPSSPLSLPKWVAFSRLISPLRIDDRELVPFPPSPGVLIALRGVIIRSPSMIVSPKLPSFFSPSFRQKLSPIFPLKGHNPFLLRLSFPL